MTTHKISIHMHEPLHRGETLILETHHTPAGPGVHIAELVSDERPGTEPDLWLTIEEIDPPDVRELSSQQAADRLGVSRPFLMANLKPYRMVGNRSRYRIEDVDAYGASLEAT